MNNHQNLLEKILKRLRFLLLESWKMNLDAVICSLQSNKNRSNTILGELLVKRRIINWQKVNCFTYKNLKFFYSNIPPFLDFLSLLSNTNDYIKKNFSKNTMYGFEGPYERGEVVLKNNYYVIDAGANFGLFTVLASEKIGVSGLIFAFEPVKSTFDLLSKSIIENNIKNVKLVNKALGQNSNKLEFLLFNNLEQSSFFNLNSEPVIAKEIVKQINLDDFVERNNLPKVDFIKADIEGMERNLLLGAEQTIKRFKPRLSICTYHLPDDPDVLERIIKDFVPEYKIVIKQNKMYAWVD